MILTTKIFDKETPIKIDRKLRGRAEEFIGRHDWDKIISFINALAREPSDLREAVLKLTPPEKLAEFCVLLLSKVNEKRKSKSSKPKGDQK